MINQKNTKQAISVIMTTYNRGLYIARALNSILKQQFTDWELIVVDDGSSDNSLNIIYEFQNTIKKMIVIEQQHKNLATGRNTGIEFSNGSYITFLDSDDEYLDSHLSSRYQYMINHPETDFIHGGVIIEGNPFVPDRFDSQKLIHLSQCVIGATFFGKKQVFETLGGFEQILYAEDAEFLDRVLRKYKVERVEYPTYVYHRDVPDSITNSIDLS
jgi:glycosyltransferase involved in cell wall biosynthesis